MKIYDNSTEVYHDGIEIIICKGGNIKFFQKNYRAPIIPNYKLLNYYENIYERVKGKKKSKKNGEKLRRLIDLTGNMMEDWTENNLRTEVEEFFSDSVSGQCKIIREGIFYLQQNYKDLPLVFNFISNVYRAVSKRQASDQTYAFFLYTHGVNQITFEIEPEVTSLSLIPFHRKNNAKIPTVPENCYCCYNTYDFFTEMKKYTDDFTRNMGLTPYPLGMFLVEVIDQKKIMQKKIDDLLSIIKTRK